MRRGQISFTTVTMIISAIIIVTVILMGKQWVTSFLGMGMESQFLIFERQFTDDVSEMGGKHGSFKTKTYGLPSAIKKVCVLDLAYRQDILGSISINDEPVMKDAMETEAESNVFIFSDTFERSFSVPDIGVLVYPHFVCKHNTGGFEIGLRGHSGKTLVMTEMMTSAQLKAGSPATVYSPDGLVTLNVPAQDNPSVDSISIEILPSTEAGQQSETYKIGPAGAVFDPPLEMTIGYIPSLVGDCPAALTFSYHYEDGSARDFDAVGIGCDSHTATFLLDRI